MIITRCAAHCGTGRWLALLLPCRGPCYPLLLICRAAVLVAVVVLATIFALRGYAPGTIPGPVLVLVAGAVAAADRFIGVQRARVVSTVSTP